MTGSLSPALTPAQTNSWPVPTPRTSITGERYDSSPDPSEAAKTEEFLNLARERFRLCVDAEGPRRGEMLTDQQFRCGIQWDEGIRMRREKGDIARPCLTINRIPGFLKHVINNMRQSRPSIKVDPVGDGADEEQAEVRQGLIRHIEVNSQADAAYDTGFENMCTMGLGWLRVVDDWADPTSFDQELLIRWVANTFTVYSDPTAQEPDWSDMKYAFIVEDLTKQEFIARYGKDKEASGLTNFQSIGDHAQFWFPGGKIRVAEYFRIEQEPDTLLELSDGQTVLFSKMEDLPEGTSIVRKRKCYVPVVYWSLISAVDKLQERKWKGQYIPLIPVIGNQIDLDGEKILVGMVRYAREPQRLYNYMYSSFVETVALAPRNQFIAEVGQVAEFRDMWERANVDPMAVLVYRMQTTEQGNLVPPPQRQSVAIDLAAFVQGLQMADQQLKAVFNIFDASLGQKGPQESGLAINARKIESDTGTYDWGDNFIRSLRQVGRVLNDLVPYYYNTPGRIVQIIREDDSRDSVVFNQEHEGKDGQPQKFDLSQGKYATVVSTGPSHDTRRKESADSMVSLAKVYPKLMEVAGDIVVRELDWPGKDAIASRIEKTLAPGLKDQDKDAPPIPPEVQNMLQQQKEQIQILTQALHAATDKHEIERMRKEYDLLMTELKNRSAEAVALIKVGSDEAKVLVGRDFQEAERLQLKLEGQEDQPQPSSAAGPQTSSGESPVGGS